MGYILEPYNLLEYIIKKGFNDIIEKIKYN